MLIKQNGQKENYQTENNSKNFFGTTFLQKTEIKDMKK